MVAVVVVRRLLGADLPPPLTPGISERLLLFLRRGLQLPLLDDEIARVPLGAATLVARILVGQLRLRTSQCNN